MPNERNDTADRELCLVRELDAPIELVWEVFSDPAHIAQWWGPHGFTNTITKMDFRPGGEWNLVMHGPDGTDYENRSVFREIVPHRRIVYEHTQPGFTATMEFEPRGERTLLTWHLVFDSREEFIEVVQQHKADIGLKQNGEKLAAYLLQQKSA